MYIFNACKSKMLQEKRLSGNVTIVGVFPISNNTKIRKQGITFYYYFYLIKKKEKSLSIICSHYILFLKYRLHLNQVIIKKVSNAKFADSYKIPPPLPAMHMTRTTAM